MNRFLYTIVASLLLQGLCGNASAQAQTQTDSLLGEPTLAHCVAYALKHFPLVQQAIGQSDKTVPHIH